jgi:prepilin-type N-terminal cleavage/methylation domain-containing protein
MRLMDVMGQGERDSAAEGSVGCGPAGFTLVEMLIGVAVICVVLFAILMMLDTNTANYARGTAKADLQQNVRVGLDDFIQDVRLAGYGVPSAPTPSALPVFCNPCFNPPPVNPFPFPICGVAGSTSPSAVAFMADLENASTTVTADAASANSLQVASNAGFLQGGTPAPPQDFIFITDGLTWDAATVTAKGGAGATQTITFTPNTAGNKLYISGTFVGRPRCIIYQLGTDATTGRQVLQRNASDNRGVLSISDNMQSLALMYYDNNNAQILPANLSASIAIIRRIGASVSGMVTPAGQPQQSFAITGDVRPRNLR